jgi:hypothetical protein
MSLALVRGSVATGSCDITPGRCLDRMDFHDICSVICNDGTRRPGNGGLSSAASGGTKRNWADKTGCEQRTFLAGRPELICNR